MLKIDKNYKESRKALIFTLPKCRLVIKQNKRALLNKDNNGRHCLLWAPDWRESRRRRLSEDRRGKRATRSLSFKLLRLFFILIVIIIIIINIRLTIINRKRQLASSLTCRSNLATIAILSQSINIININIIIIITMNIIVITIIRRKKSTKLNSRKLLSSLSLVGQQRSSFVATHFVHNTTTTATSKY